MRKQKNSHGNEAGKYRVGKDEYKINISEIRITIKEYYEMELAILADT